MHCLLSEPDDHGEPMIANLSKNGKNPILIRKESINWVNMCRKLTPEGVRELAEFVLDGTVRSFEMDGFNQFRRKFQNWLFECDQSSPMIDGLNVNNGWWPTNGIVDSDKLVHCRRWNVTPTAHESNGPSAMDYRPAALDLFRKANSCLTRNQERVKEKNKTETSIKIWETRI